jgi:glycosyltransferase involved in cell wall biosynthesis
MSNTPLVSILIVAHNPGMYLSNTLKSCLKQTYENTEILLLDNTSNEDISIYIPEV